MHTLVLIALILLVFGVGPSVVPAWRAAYGGYGYYGVGLCLIVLCVLYLTGSLLLK
jgi:hypothetical protein